MNKKLLALTVPLLLSSCADSGPDRTITPVNQVRQTETVRITSVVPAKITKTNNHNKTLARTIGGLLGAAAGIIAVQEAGGGGNLASAGAGLGGAYAGGTLGGVAVKSTKKVNGVDVFFRRKNGQTLSTTEFGRPCQFRAGPATIEKVGTSSINVLPNATCSKK